MLLNYNTNLRKRYSIKPDIYHETSVFLNKNQNNCKKLTNSK